MKANYRLQNYIVVRIATTLTAVAIMSLYFSIMTSKQIYSIQRWCNVTEDSPSNFLFDNNGVTITEVSPEQSNKSETETNKVET